MQRGRACLPIKLFWARSISCKSVRFAQLEGREPAHQNAMQPALSIRGLSAGHASITDKVLHWAYQSDCFGTQRAAASLSDSSSWRAGSLRSTVIMHPALFARLSIEGLSAGHVSMTSSVVHQAHQSDCSETDRAPASLSNSPSWRARSLRSTYLMQPMLFASLYVYGFPAYHASMLSISLHHAYQSGCSGPERDSARLSDSPSWRARTLHSTNIMQPSLFTGLPVQACQLVMCLGRAQLCIRLTTQMVWDKRSLCNPVRLAPSSCIRRSLPVSQSWAVSWPRVYTGHIIASALPVRLF